MFIALDKIHNQGLKKAVVVVPENLLGPASTMNPSAISAFGQTGTSSHSGICVMHPARTAARLKVLGHS